MAAGFFALETKSEYINVGHCLNKNFDKKSSQLMLRDGKNVCSWHKQTKSYQRKRDKNV